MVYDIVFSLPYQVMHVLNKMLTLDPEARITLDAALEMPWLKSADPLLMAPMR